MGPADNEHSIVHQQSVGLTFGEQGVGSAPLMLQNDVEENEGDCDSLYLPKLNLDDVNSLDDINDQPTAADSRCT